MNTRTLATLIGLLSLLFLADSMNTAFGRGGRGGGGGFGGGGMSRPSGGFSGGGSVRSSGGFSGGARPSVGSSPSLNRPTGGTARPVTSAPRTGLVGGSGSRPSLQPRTRPNSGTGSGLAGGAGISSRPATLPATRPGTGAALGSRPSTFPGTQPGVGIGNSVNIGIGGNRPGTSLPGLGSGTAGSRLPNQGAGLQDRVANRPQTLDDRRNSLSDRMTTGREDWQQHRSDMQNDRQDWRDNNREDWQDFADNNLDHHGDWYNGCWEPGDGWDYMWDNYPGAAALGVTRWGVNRLAYGFGYWGYSNPYAGGSSSSSYSYSEPLVVYADSGAVADPNVTSAESVPTGPPEPTEAGMSSFEQARTSFYAGEYETALTQLDVTLQTMPRDTVVHEFRGLVLFALKKYPESAAAVYAVLSAGPGWDWTTMSGLYPNVEVYTQQLRELEGFTKSNPSSADGSFLLGYHYLTMGYKEVSGKYFALALQQLPGDKLLTQLVGMTPAKRQAVKTPPPAPPTPIDLAPEKILSVEKMVGTWKASSSEAQFELSLTKEGTFVWSYSRGTSKESVKGVFAVDQNNLAMEPDAGGTMLAEINISGPTQFQFKMIGSGPDDQGLVFVKN
jgi:tetratricopeptide (TPR) repeat protein